MLPGNLQPRPPASATRATCASLVLSARKPKPRRPPRRYAFNIIFNILNKSALNSFPCPWLISTLQLGKATNLQAHYANLSQQAAARPPATLLTSPLPYSQRCLVLFGHSCERPVYGVPVGGQAAAGAQG